MAQQLQQQEQQTPRQLRIVLAEIPNGFDVMNVGNNTQQNNNNNNFDTRMRNGNLTTPTTPTTHFDHTTNVAQQMLTETSISPEEIVLQQRGRRRSTVNITSTNNNNNNNKNKNSAMPFQRTPTKILTSSMILRSSPRKRLSMGTLPPKTPTKKESQQQQHYDHNNYNIKVGLTIEEPANEIHIAFNNKELMRPIVQKNNDLPLEQLLSAMSSQQLIKIIVNNLVAGNKDIDKKLRQNLPMADISPLEQELTRAKNNIFKAMPTSRLCAKTDSPSYSRAVTHLNEFKRLIYAHTKQLNDSGHWDALFDYVHMAWKTTRSTPLWEYNTQNSVRRQCFLLLSKYCALALNNGNISLGAMRLEKMEKNIKLWLNDNENAILCQQMLDKLLTKGRHSV